MNHRFIVGVFSVQQWVEGVVLSSSILTIAALTIANVISRFLMGLSFAVVEELIQMLMLVICFVGMSYAAGQARHIRMSAVFDVLPAKSRQRMMLLISFATSMLMFALVGYSMQYVLTVFELGAIYPATRVPYFVVYLLAPLGFCLTGIQYALTAFQNSNQSMVYHSFSIPEPSRVTDARGPSGAEVMESPSGDMTVDGKEGPR